MTHRTLAAILAITGSSQGMALDMNRNGISDVWESLYPSAVANPQSDLDGDGISNRGEGVAWTDPTDPASVFKIEDYQHLAGTDQFGFGGVPWMRDEVRSSSDLLEWDRLGPAGKGDGTAETVTVATGQPSRFHRVVRYDSLNSDTDALTNKEEQLLGTNPLLWDSDGDKVADDIEFLNGTNPLTSVDTDGDNIPDDWEQWCIKSNPSDAVAGLTDVNETTDFDNDGVLDIVEFGLGTSPVQALRNVILFLSEDQGIDLGCLGTVGISTPSIDSFAGSGMIFERAFAMASVCSPSKMAMFTGQFCHQNSAYRNVVNYGTDFPLVGDPSLLSLGGVHEDLPTLIEVLRDRGYFTATSHKSHVQPIRKWPYSEGYGQPTSTANATAYINDLVTQAGNRPFYMTFGIGAPHLPFRSISQAQGVWSSTGGLTNDGHATNVDAAAIVVPNCYPDVPGVRQDIADYYGAIQCVDNVFGAVMTALQANGVLDDTLVIYTSDHGIGLHRAKQSIYSTGTQVPFIVAGAGIQSGVRTKVPVSHADVFPTLLDLMGVPRLPGLSGTSLMPMLTGASSTVAGRETVMTTSSQGTAVGRAVCDGKYYYIRNVAKVTGASFASPANAMNTDQYQGGSPWFNRAFDATNAATGSVGRQLLADLLAGTVPDEELYDLDTDPWCVTNLANDSSLTSVKTKLKGELGTWRSGTEDYNVSPNEVVRRELRFTDPTGGSVVTGTPVVDNFDGKSGNLGADAGWTTLIAGNLGADYALVSNGAKAPAGPLTLTQWDAATVAVDGTFTVSVKTGFDGTGVAGGLAFGITSDGNGGQNWWQFLLADGRSAAGGTGKDIRLFRVNSGVQVNPALLSENGLADYATNGSLFTLEVSGQAGSSIVSLRVVDPSGAVYFSNPSFDLGAPVPVGSKFGMTTWSSASSIFDDFALSQTNAPRSVLLDFDTGTGNLSGTGEWFLSSGGNGGADFVHEGNPFPSGTGNVIDAPAGGPAVSVYQNLPLAAGESFTASVDTGFIGAGIYGGLVFGFQDNSNYLFFELADGASASTINRLFRIRTRSGGVFSDVLFPPASSFPIAQRSKLYRLTVSGVTGSAEIDYSVVLIETSAVLASGTLDLPAAIPPGSRFGIISETSSASKFDRLSISTTP